MEMAKTISNEEYQKQLLQHFDDLTGEEIIQLLTKTKSYLKEYEVEDVNRDYLISGIVETCIERKQITFKQWKAVSAFCRDCDKLKSVNEKVKALEVEKKFKTF